MEPPRRENSEDALQSNVRRMQEAILQAQHRQAAYIQTWMNQGSWPLSRRARRRLERRVARQIRRQEWNRRRGPAWAPAIVFFTLGVWFLSMAARHPAADRFAVLALGFILGAVAFLMRGRSRRSEPEKAAQSERIQTAEQRPLESNQALPPQQQVRTEPDRTEALCEKLILEVRASPQALRQVVHRPEETIASLRKACAALRQREQSLRALVTAEDSRRLDAERVELTKRIGSETDEVVRDRLSAALKSLDEQVQQRSNLAISAARLEAERTRIHYALENLYTQVLSVKSADAASADVAGAGLRQSLSRLSDEVSAVAESLEAVSRGDESPFSPVTSVSADASSPQRANRERS
jgi:hypothetical protein